MVGKASSAVICAKVPARPAPAVEMANDAIVQFMMTVAAAEDPPPPEKARVGSVARLPCPLSVQTRPVTVPAPVSDSAALAL